MMYSKPFYASKTFWFNVVAFVVAGLAGFGYTGELPVEWAVFVPAVIAVVNVILRFLTKQPVTL